VGVDVEAELREDGEPDVVGADAEVLVLVAGHDGGVDEAVGGGVDGVGGWSGGSGLGGGSGVGGREHGSRPRGREHGSRPRGRERASKSQGNKRRRMESISGGPRRDSFPITPRPSSSSSAAVTSMRTSSNPPNNPPSPISPRITPQWLLIRGQGGEREGRLEEFSAGLAFGWAGFLEEVYGAAGDLWATIVDEGGAVG